MPKPKRSKPKSKGAVVGNHGRAVQAAGGFTSMALHAYDDDDASIIAQLSKQKRRGSAFALAAPIQLRDADPETAAKRYLDEAIQSAATPAVTAPMLGPAMTEFKSLGTETVPLTGTTMVKFRQCIDKIPVYGSLVTVELDERNDLVSLNSSVGSPQGIDALARISPADAVNTVKNYPGYVVDVQGVIPRLNFYFEQASLMWHLVFILEDVPTKPVASGKRTAEAEAGKRRSVPHFMDFVVDAHTGKIVAVLPRTATARLITAKDGRGTARKFRIEQVDGKRILSDPKLNVKTHDFGFRDPDVERRKLPGTPIADPPTWSPSAVSAHANSAEVANFLRTVLKRNNIDAKGGSINSSINCLLVEEGDGVDQWINAYWDGDQMVYGQCRVKGRLASLAEWLDIVAHEMFHGITDETARLEYASESGALNESYSDIFGVIIANYSISDTRKWDWRIGNGLDRGKPFRDMAKPGARGQPDHMRKYKKLPNTEAGDWGGVHINSGIHNKAAYNILVAEDRAGKLILTPTEVISIFYVALTQHLTRTSLFVNSARSVLLSARSLLRKLPAAKQAAKISAIEAGFVAVGII